MTKLLVALEWHYDDQASESSKVKDREVSEWPGNHAVQGNSLIIVR